MSDVTFVVIALPALARLHKSLLARLVGPYVVSPGTGAEISNVRFSAVSKVVSLGHMYCYEIQSTQPAPVALTCLR